MGVDRSAIVDRNLLQLIERWEQRPGRSQTIRPDPDDGVRAGTSLTGREALELLESQFVARHLDLVARDLKKRGESFYTIGSCGHEGNVVLGRLLSERDPTFLHYRSGALMVERARHVPGATPIFDVLLSLAASREDPISGGRHKVFGSRQLWVPPQTSTIASHLPKALGTAFALDRAHAVGQEVNAPADAIVACTFGDATVNHATAQAAFNAASWTAFQKLPLPLLFVCEDNHIGISVRTPANWVLNRFRNMPGIAYFRGDGLDLPSAWNAARAAVDHVRRRRAPAFLHLEVVRLLGHAGSDVETEYRLRGEIEADERLDPLHRSVELVLDAGLVTPTQIKDLYEEIRARVVAGGREAATRPKLESAREIMAPLAPHREDKVAEECQRIPDPAARVELFGSEKALPENATRRRHLAIQLNRALTDALATYPEMLLFGEDVGRKGGVYNVTTGLTERAGIGRVFNTLLDETTILGLAIGAAHLGLLPVPEIQYLAYYHNAEDQLRGEACSLQYFSQGQFKNPMVVRIASFGYQRGFGGHFHNDNSIAVLRDLPGLIIAAPARPDDAVRLLRTCLAAAKVDGAVCVFLEPIALYMMKDLHEPGDGRWLTDYPPPGDAAPLGRGRVDPLDAGDEADAVASADDLTIITYANGTYLSHRAARTLANAHGIRARIVDLLWLAPLDEDLIVEQAAATGCVLVVDESRKTAGISEAVYTIIADRLSDRMPQLARITGEDTYIPLGPAAHEVLPTEDSIVAAAVALMQESKRDAGS
ncbi:MAG: MFS transporter [Planctomycetes bacterium]|nr:MFS transporter [Planctomycetota bacterium]